MDTQSDSYPARFDIDYPETLNRVTTLFRLILIIPITIILVLLTSTVNESVVTETGEQVGGFPPDSGLLRC